MVVVRDWCADGRGQARRTPAVGVLSTRKSRCRAWRSASIGILATQSSWRARRSTSVWVLSTCESWARRPASVRVNGRRCKPRRAAAVRVLGSSECGARAWRTPGVRVSRVEASVARHRRSAIRRVIRVGCAGVHGRTRALPPVRHLALRFQRLHFHVVGTVGFILDALVGRAGPCGHRRERIIVHLGGCTLGRIVKGGRLHGASVDWRGWRRLVSGFRDWRRGVVNRGLVVVFGCSLPAPAGRTAAAEAATACGAALVATAETIDYAAKNGDDDNRDDDDSNDHRPPTRNWSASCSLRSCDRHLFQLTCSSPLPCTCPNYRLW